MRRLKRVFLLILAGSLVFSSLYSVGWAQEKPVDSMDYRTNLIDLFIARPLGIVAAAAGTGFFVLSLPFTLPTRSVDYSFNTFVVEPWKFSFVREFPDEETY